MTIWAVIPARPPSEGKSRLAAVLPDKERMALNEHFFRRTLGIACQVLGPSRVLVVTRSPALLRRASEAGAAGLRERGTGGLNAALTQAAQRLEGAKGILAVSCDLPLLDPEDLQAMLIDGPGIAIAPDEGERGTNALLVAPVGAIPYCYGPDSFAAHLAAAEGKARIIRRPGLAFDVDTPADLERMDWRFGPPGIK